MWSGCEDQDDNILGWGGRPGEPGGHLIVGVDVLDSSGASSDCHVLRALLLQPLDHQLSRLFLRARKDVPVSSRSVSTPAHLLQEVASQPRAMETVQDIVPPQ